ncbi:glycosyltransferase [Alteromonas sp. H39]|uniref:glycosyltransferase n=1 Tax=Alteromonas sp. H39 TaxID=3389876 RepID=UPI0039E07734
MKEIGSNPYSVTVVIPSYNDNIRLEQCVEALQQQSIGKEAFQIIAVDNGSDTPPENLQNRFANVEVLTELKPGSYNARNKALEVINTDYVAFTDSDCVPDKNWLKNSINYLEVNNVDAVGGLIKLFPKDENNIQPVEILDMLYSFEFESYRAQRYCPTANLIVRRSAFEKAGIFDGSMMSGGDREWCNRLQNNCGVLEFCEEVIVNHPARSTSSEYFTRRRRLAHGAWGKRHKSINHDLPLGFKGFISGLLPPIKRFQEIFRLECQTKTIHKIEACLILYIGKIYSQFEILKCRFGLVKAAERR